jgi:predicted metal-binding protein
MGRPAAGRVEVSCPECSGCLVVKQGTSVVWKIGNEVSKEFAASMLKENKCQFL